MIGSLCRDREWSGMATLTAFAPLLKNDMLEIPMNGWNLYQDVEVQKRRHKKKRINKKWAKRYGYIVKQVPFGNGTFRIESYEGDSHVATLISGGKI